MASQKKSGGTKKAARKTSAPIVADDIARLSEEDALIAGAPVSSNLPPGVPDSLGEILDLITGGLERSEVVEYQREGLDPLEVERMRTNLYRVVSMANGKEHIGTYYSKRPEDDKWTNALFPGDAREYWKFCLEGKWYHLETGTYEHTANEYIAMYQGAQRSCPRRPDPPSETAWDEFTAMLGRNREPREIANRLDWPFDLVIDLGGQGTCHIEPSGRLGAVDCFDFDGNVVAFVRIPAKGRLHVVGPRAFIRSWSHLPPTSMLVRTE